MVERPKVFLIGGPPGVGKTTLGRALSRRIDASSLSIDDLLAAVKAVTTAESHPALYIMSRLNFVDYFTTASVDQLKADATVQHEATWPAIEKVIRNHATWGSPIVIEGWALRPEKVAGLDLPNVKSFWLVAKRGVLEERERKNVEFVQNSSDPDRMLQNFLARSIWYNDFIRAQAEQLQVPILEQDGHVTVDELCDRVLQGL